ncbi:hypothetical protein [Aeromonas hydrophila]
MKADFSKKIRNPFVWGPLLAIIAIGGGIGARKLIDGSQASVPDTAAQEVHDPVYYPPQRVEPATVVIDSTPTPVSERVVFDDDLLQKAKAYRLAKIQAMEDELKKKPELPVQGGFTPGLLTPPTPPSGSAKDDVPSSPLSVAMVVMGQVPMAWVSKGSEQPKSGLVGDTVYGKRITRISPEKVCFSDKTCLRAN